MKPAIRFAVLIIGELRNLMLLHEWDIDVETDPNPVQENTLAHIKVQNDYLRATILLCPPYFERFTSRDKEYLARALTHEMSHILTEPLYDIAINAITNTSAKFLEITREQQTTRIASCIFPRLPKRLYA